MMRISTRTPAPHWGLAVQRAALALCLALCGFASGCSRGPVDVILANGLDAPVTITFGGDSHSLAPRAQKIIEVPLGLASIRSTDANGELIEEFEILVEANKDVQLYNVLAAAPAFTHVTHYGAANGAPDDPFRNVTLYDELLWVSLDDIDYVLEPVEDRVQEDDDNGGARRTSFEVTLGGWRDTAVLIYLTHSANEQLARDFVGRLGAHADYAKVDTDLEFLSGLVHGEGLAADATFRSMLNSIERERLARDSTRRVPRRP